MFNLLLCAVKTGSKSTLYIRRKPDAAADWRKLSYFIIICAYCIKIKRKHMEKSDTFMESAMRIKTPPERPEANGVYAVMLFFVRAALSEAPHQGSELRR